MRRGPVVLAMDRVALSGVAEAIPATPSIATPTITSPADAAVDVSTSPTVTSSAFAVTNGGSDTHASSDWQAATDAGFSTVVEESLADTTNKTSYDFSGLDPETEHWVRVRHNGTTYGASGWSPAVSFTTAAAPAYDADAQAFIDAMGTTPNSAVQDAINDLVVALKATTAGWSGADRIFLPRMPTLADSLLDLKHPAGTSATAVNSPTHTPYLGIAGNGSTSYLNSNFVPRTDGVNYTRDDAAVGIWLSGGTDTAATKAAMGARQAGVVYADIFARESGDKIIGDVNGNMLSGFGSNGSVTTRAGLTFIQRTSSSASEAFKNGVSVGTHSISSVLPPTVAMFIGATNNSGVAAYLSDNQTRAVWIGSSMDATDHADVYAAFAAFDTAMAAAAP